MEFRRYAGAELEKMSPTQLLEFAFHWSGQLTDGNWLDGDDEATIANKLDIAAHCVNNATQEIEVRWGAEAHDNLAEYFTASHASRDDMLRLAREQADLLVEIAKGEHDCGAHEGDFKHRGMATDAADETYHQYGCRCGRIWGRPVGGNTYFDPTNTTVEEVIASADRN